MTVFMEENTLFLRNDGWGRYKASKW